MTGTALDWRVPGLLAQFWPAKKVVSKMKGWTRIKWAGVMVLTDEDRGVFVWRWRPVQKRSSRGLQLISPRGVVWDFKLTGGAWIKRAEQNAERGAERHADNTNQTVNYSI